jgi:hypothetical protein
MPPAGPEESPDDVMPAPGMGPQYRANIFAQGKANPWPPIEIATIELENYPEKATVYYQESIETKAGETSNNIIKVFKESGEIDSLDFYTTNIPEGIKLTIGMEWSGPRAGAAVLLVEVAENVAIGEYKFDIRLSVNDKYLGNLPCIINVAETVSYPPVIPSTAVQIPFEYIFSPDTAELAPDTVIFVPGGGGMEYNANIHEVGKPYVPIRVAYENLTDGSDVVTIKYRQDIETRAGETRNNLIHVTHANGSPYNDGSLFLYAVDVPAGITLRQGSGDITSNYSLRISIPVDIPIAGYTFKIGFIINGKDFGTLPCTVNVIP